MIENDLLKTQVREEKKTFQQHLSSLNLTKSQSFSPKFIVFGSCVHVFFGEIEYRFFLSFLTFSGIFKEISGAS